MAKLSVNEEKVKTPQSSQKDYVEQDNYQEPSIQAQVSEQIQDNEQDQELTPEQVEELTP